MQNCRATNEQTRLRLLIRAGWIEKWRTTPSFIPMNALHVRNALGRQGGISEKCSPDMQRQIIFVPSIRTCGYNARVLQIVSQKLSVPNCPDYRRGAHGQRLIVQNRKGPVYVTRPTARFAFLPRFYLWRQHTSRTQFDSIDYPAVSFDEARQCRCLCSCRCSTLASPSGLSCFGNILRIASPHQIGLFRTERSIALSAYSRRR